MNIFLSTDPHPNLSTGKFYLTPRDQKQTNKQTTGAQLQRFLKKPAIHLPYGQDIPLLDIYQEDCVFYYGFTSSFMFVAALLTIATTWKQPKYPSA